MSLARTLRNIRKGGIKQYWHNLNYIGDAKVGTLVGTDRWVSSLEALFETESGTDIVFFLIQPGQ